VNCGDGPYVEVHHIDGDCFNNHPMNLAPLCYRCHKHIHELQRASDRVKDMKDELQALGGD